MNYQIGALGAEAQTADFACGEPVLDQYLQRYARQDIKRGVARVFVATAEPQPAEVLGFYTLSAASIAADTLPENWRKRLPRYPVPVALPAVWLCISGIMARGWGLFCWRMLVSVWRLPVPRWLSPPWW